jgi:hypothetical protein
VILGYRRRQNVLEQIAEGERAAIVFDGTSIDDLPADIGRGRASIRVAKPNQISEVIPEFLTAVFDFLPPAR